MLRPLRVTSGLLSVALICTGCARPTLRVAPEILAAAPAEVLERVRSNPYNYFRLTNHEWTTRACAIFAADLASQPIVQLHGDAHIEQFAFMDDSWGLDDFDDSARGPALVDIVRFLGSTDLAARAHRWEHERNHLFDRFFSGYRRGITEPDYEPPEPRIVRRLKSEAQSPTPVAFLEWADSKMTSMAPTQMNGVVAAMKVFSDAVRSERPELPDTYFAVVRAGWLHMGVGSSQSLKVLIRTEGPSNDRLDDVVLEAKATVGRSVLPCREEATSQPTFRIIQGSRQVGRLKHEIIAPGPDVVIPDMTIQVQHLRDWWIHSWNPTYHEISIDDLSSVDELADVVYDSGVQLGAGALRHVSAAEAVALRTQSLSTLETMEPRLRRAAEQLVEELLRGWRDLPEPARN